MRDDDANASARYEFSEHRLGVLAGLFPFSLIKLAAEEGFRASSIGEEQYFNCRDRHEHKKTVGGSHRSERFSEK